MPVTEDSIETERTLNLGLKVGGRQVNFAFTIQLLKKGRGTRFDNLKKRVAKQEGKQKK